MNFRSATHESLTDQRIGSLQCAPPFLVVGVRWVRLERGICHQEREREYPNRLAGERLGWQHHDGGLGLRLTLPLRLETSRGRQRQ